MLKVESIVVPRFSPKAKKIFDMITYKTDIEQSKVLSKELTNPIDIIFIKIWMLFGHFSTINIELALAELEDLNLSNPDNFNSYFINCHYFNYYAGYFNPMINIELAEKYFMNLESNYIQIDFLDDWEKYFCEGWYYYFKAIYNHRIGNNLGQGIIFSEKSKESFRLIPEDGWYFAMCIGNNNLAFFQRLAGYFDEAEKNFLIALQEAEKYDSLRQNYPLYNLQALYFQKGELEKIIEFNERSINLCKKFNLIWGIYMNLDIKGDLFYEEGNYDKALKCYQESLIYRKQSNDPLTVSEGYLNLFHLYYQIFKVNEDKEYYSKAENMLRELKKFKDLYPDNNTILNFVNFAEAMILKFGNVTKRAKSVMLFEELTKIWPGNFGVTEEYLEFLFEDYMISEDQETLDKINTLMESVNKFPLFYNSIGNFVTQQIMLARYQFFIKDDIETAFVILNKAKEKISPYKIERFNSQLEHELMNFKNERTKWEKTDISVKERIQKSEFQKYIQEALNIKLG